MICLEIESNVIAISILFRHTTTHEREAERVGQRIRGEDASGDGRRARYHRPLRAPAVLAAARPGSSERQPAERGALPVHAEGVGKVRGVAVELREVRG